MSSSFNHQLTQVTISSTEELSRDLFLISFKRTFKFVAGQVIGITLREDDARRLYSICSGENEDEVHILYKVVAEGYLTPQLSDLEVGDSIWITRRPDKKSTSSRRACLEVNTQLITTSDDCRKVLIGDTGIRTPSLGHLQRVTTLSAGNRCKS